MRVYVKAESESERDSVTELKFHLSFVSACNESERVRARERDTERESERARGVKSNVEEEGRESISRDKAKETKILRRTHFSAHLFRGYFFYTNTDERTNTYTNMYMFMHTRKHKY